MSGFGEVRHLRDAHHRHVHLTANEVPVVRLVGDDVWHRIGSDVLGQRTACGVSTARSHQTRVLRPSDRVLRCMRCFS